MFKYRLFLAAAIGCIALLVLGIGESLRCIRAIFGPSTVAFSQASTQGLAGFGYVRITGVQSLIDNTVVTVKGSRNGAPENDVWTGAYVPLTDAAAPDAGSCSLLAWLPHARSPQDLVAMAQVNGESQDQIVGFVKCDYQGLDYNEQNKIAPLARINTRNCWVVDVRPPSWLKGLGFTLAGLAIPGAAVAYKLKKGFV